MEVEDDHRAEEEEDLEPFAKNGILFMGSGSSSGAPVAYQLMNPLSVSSSSLRRVTQLGALGDPRENKNYRCNPSLLLRFDAKNVLIDAGKTFRESSIRWFPCNKVKNVDAIILTHGHADAIFGLDDVRSIQPSSSTSSSSSTPMPVYCNQDCFAVVSRMFPYLLPSPAKEEQQGSVQRKVASLDFHIFDDYSEFSAAGLTFLPVPVMHGEDMTCSGFIFGRKSVVCYLSDISRMLPKTLDIIRERHIDLLIVDALLMVRSHPFHYSMLDAIELCKQIKPSKALLVGMTSEFDHEDVNKKLKDIVSAQIGVDIQLANDGLFVEIDI